MTTGKAALSKLSKESRRYNAQEPFSLNTETWPPPDQSIKFTPLVLIYHKDQHTMKETTAMAKLIQTGGINKLNSPADNRSVPESLREILDAGSGVVNKDLAEILATYTRTMQRSKIYLN